MKAQLNLFMCSWSAMIYNLLDELRWKRFILLPPLILDTSSISACASNTIVGGIIRREETKKEQKKEFRPKEIRNMNSRGLINEMVFNWGESWCVLGEPHLSINWGGPKAIIWSHTASTACEAGNTSLGPADLQDASLEQRPACESCCVSHSLPISAALMLE